MKNKFSLVLAMVLLAGPVSAELIQSTTSVLLTFRQCVEGVTICDSFSEIKMREFGGLPGDREAHASQSDSAYGESTGSAKLTGEPGGAEIKADIISLPGARNGSNGFILQRYTNTGASAETLTFSGTLSYDQTVPAENADFPADNGSQSNAFAEMEIFTLNVDSIEAGTTSSDNNAIMSGESDQEVEYAMLKNMSAQGHQNESGKGSKSISESVVIEPGESVWMFAILQSLGANGAVINASLETVATFK